MTSSSSSSKKSAMTPSISATSTIASSSASSSAGTSGGESNNNSGFQVPLTHDSLTFEARQAVRLKEMERKVDEELRKRRSEWKRDVAHMREEIFQLHPVANSSDSADGIDECIEQTPQKGGEIHGNGNTEDTDPTESHPQLEPFVARRRGSTDVLDVRKMRTLYLEYPDAGRRCKLRFDVTGMDPDRLEVTTDGERIIVRGTRVIQTFADEIIESLKEGNEGTMAGCDDNDDKLSMTPSTDDNSCSPMNSESSEKGKLISVHERHYVRKIEKPKDVDHTKLHSSLTTDGILVVEAPLPPATLNLRSRASSGSPRSATSGGNSAAATGNHQQHNGGGGSGNSTSASSSASNLPRLAAKSSPSRGGTGGGVGGCGSQTGSMTASPSTVSNCSATGTAVGSSNQSTTAANILQFARELHGVPTFRDGYDGRRRMFLVVEVGMMFSAKEITVQIIRDSRIQIKARHEERTSERLSRSKFSKDYELHERIESYSLRGGLTHDGRLMIGSLVKSQGQRMSKVAAGELIAEELAALADHEPCNVLDLSTFPPTTPALIAGTSSMTTSMTSSSSSG